METHPQEQPRLLDVRPIVDKGDDPFRLIVRTVGELGPDESLHLVIGFDPIPLYAVLENRGFKHRTEMDGGDFHVWFQRGGRVPAKPQVAPFAERTGLCEPVEMDVRDLEPPGPMIAILEKLAELGEGAQLLVHHHREPVLSDEKLAARGYAARIARRGEGHYLAHIAPDWAFEPDGDKAA